MAYSNRSGKFNHNKNGSDTSGNHVFVYQSTYIFRIYLIAHTRTRNNAWFRSHRRSHYGSNSTLFVQRRTDKNSIQQCALTTCITIAFLNNYDFSE